MASRVVGVGGLEGATSFVLSTRAGCFTTSRAGGLGSKAARHVSGSFLWNLFGPFVSRALLCALFAGTCRLSTDATNPCWESCWGETFKGFRSPAGLVVSRKCCMYGDLRTPFGGTYSP